MKNKGLLFFATFVALFIGFVVYDFQKDQNAEVQKEKQSILVPMAANDINEFSIKKNSQNLSLKKDASGWVFTAPISELADQKVVSEFIDNLVKEKSTGIAVESNSIDWKAFGLDSSNEIIEIKDTKGTSLLFKIGTIKNFQGDAFLQKGSENKVLISSSSWFNRLDKKPFDFRDRRLMRFPTNNVKGIELKQGLKKITLSKREDQWVSIENQNWKLDQNKVRELLSLFETTNIEEFLIEGEIKPDQFKSYNLGESKLDLSVDFGDTTATEKDKKWSAQLFLNKDKKHIAKIQTPVFLVRIAEFGFKKFMEITLDSLRDRHEPLNYNKNDVKRVFLSSSGQEYDFIEKEGKWTWQNAMMGKELDVDKLNNVLSRIRNLSVGSFLDKPDDSGLQKIQKKIVMKAADGKDLFQLEIGQKRQAKIDGGEVAALPMRSSLVKNVFLMKESDINDLKLDELVKTTTTTTTTATTVAPK